MTGQSSVRASSKREIYTKHKYWTHISVILNVLSVLLNICMIFFHRLTCVNIDLMVDLLQTFNHCVIFYFRCTIDSSYHYSGLRLRHVLRWKWIVSYIMLSYVILCYIVLSYVILCYLMWYYVILCYITLSCVVLCYLILSYVIFCYLMLSYVILSYLILSYRILCYLMLSYPILSYLIFVVCKIVCFNIKNNHCWLNDINNARKYLILWEITHTLDWLTMNK